MASYSVSGSDGTAFSEGIRTAREANRIAVEYVRRRGEACSVYVEGTGVTVDDDEPGDEWVVDATDMYGAPIAA